MDSELGMKIYGITCGKSTQSLFHHCTLKMSFRTNRVKLSRDTSVRLRAAKPGRLREPFRMKNARVRNQRAELFTRMSQNICCEAFATSWCCRSCKGTKSASLRYSFWMVLHSWLRRRPGLAALRRTLVSWENCTRSLTTFWGYNVEVMRERTRGDFHPKLRIHSQLSESSFLWCWPRPPAGPVRTCD